MFGRRATPEAHQVDFSGSFENSAFAVGDHAVANTYNGTVIQHFAADTAPRPTRRPPPQRVPPRDPIELLGREPEVERVRAALSAASVVGLHGASGVGKTVLLKHVAAADRDGFPDGVVFANAGGQPLEDILQWLFTLFWDTGEIVFAPGPLRIGAFLRDVRALVVLDDLGLGGSDVERLVDGAPACGFALGAVEPPAPDERSFPLRGLPAEAARALFARVLGRAPAEADLAAVDAFTERVERLPGYVVTGAQLVRDGVCDVAELAAQPGAVLARRRLLALPAAQQELLGLLAELAPAPVPVAHAGPDADSHFDRLREARIVERNSPRYTLSGPFDAAAAHDLAVGGARRLLDRVVAEPEGIEAADLPAVVAALDRASGADDPTVLEAARAFVPAAIRAGRTGAWGGIAAIGLRAARQLDRPSDEALFLHEAGTRLGCLGERGPAYEALTRARDIRRELGDDAAVAVTEHNLRELFGGPGGPGDDGDPGDDGGHGGHGRRVLLGGLAALALLGGGVAAFGGDTNDPRPPDVVPPAPATTKDTRPPDATTGRAHHDDPVLPLPQRPVITSPENGRTYAPDDPIPAHYTCPGTPRRRCTSHVKQGNYVDRHVGPHEFEVTAYNAQGRPTSTTVNYKVVATRQPEHPIKPPPDHPPDHRSDPPPFVVYAVADPPRFLVPYSCKRGDEPVACTATLDGVPIGRRTILNCGDHTVVGIASDDGTESDPVELSRDCEQWPITPNTTSTSAEPSPDLSSGSGTTSP